MPSQPPPVRLTIKETAGMGEGVFACSEIPSGTECCEYEGKLIFIGKKPRRGKFPPDVDEHTKSGNFSYFLKSKKTSDVYCIDANESTGFGRKINHSKKLRNVKTEIVEANIGHPRLFFRAIRDIKIGEQLFYDYGERDREILRNFPWLGQ
jgi:SET domain-containing protein